jgi:hypothetical protein
MPDQPTNDVANVLRGVASGAISPEHAEVLLGRLGGGQRAEQPQHVPEPDPNTAHLDGFARQIDAARQRSGWVSRPIIGPEGER